jgi:D-3-phosphoglycerate dehydrogenase
LPKVLITTVPFGDKDRLPLDLQENAGIEYLINPFNKKITEKQLTNIIFDFDAIIAGTEPITEKVLDRANKLKLISRVGIGLDSVDLIAAQKRDIKVSYTPDAPLTRCY